MANVGFTGVHLVDLPFYGSSLWHLATPKLPRCRTCDVCVCEMVSGTKTSMVEVKIQRPTINKMLKRRFGKCRESRGLSHGSQLQEIEAQALGPMRPYPKARLGLCHMPDAYSISE